MNGQSKSFSELNEQKIDSDLFSYHLRQLVNKEYIEKQDGYQLTTKGKQTLLLFNKKNESTKNQRVSILLIIKNKEKYLVQERKVAPFKGFWEFPTIKVPFGETPATTALLLLKTEIGLVAKLKYMGIVHKVEQTLNNSIFDDKYYLVYVVQTKEEMIQTIFDEGINHWLTLEEMKTKKNHFDLSATLEILNKKEIFSEIKGFIGEY